MGTLNLAGFLLAYTYVVVYIVFIFDVYEIL